MMSIRHQLQLILRFARTPVFIADKHDVIGHGHIQHSRYCSAAVASAVSDQEVDDSPPPEASTSAPATPQLTPPLPDGAPEKDFSPKIVTLVDQIAELSLFEVADLNTLLKRRLNLPDAPIMPAGIGMVAAAEPKEEASKKKAAPSVSKTSFDVKLIKYDDSKKIPLIKEVKNLVKGLNLVQAKKFVESVPHVIKSDMGLDEAEKLKEALTALGGECVID